MVVLCQVCWRYLLKENKLSKTLCEACFDEIAPFYFIGNHTFCERNGLIIHRVLPYQGWFRNRALAAKVKSDLGALNCLVEMFMHSPAINMIMHDIDGIVPVPSSIWSRFNNRFDVAFQLASSLSTRFAVPLLPLPNPYYFRRLLKRARTRDSSTLTKFDQMITSLFPRDLRKIRLGGCHLLIIDDIVTTGLSLLEVSQAFPDSKNSFVAMFDASWKLDNQF